MKVNANYPHGWNSQQKRYDKLYHPMWVTAMTMLISIKVKHRFRWFDSGDIDSVQHLRNIIEVCNGTPHIQHWLVTKEKRTVRQFLDEGGIVPDNLVIQMSGYVVDGDRVKGFHDCKQITQHVVPSDRATARGYTCPVAHVTAVSSGDESHSVPCVDRASHIFTIRLPDRHPHADAS